MREWGILGEHWELHASEILWCASHTVPGSEDTFRGGCTFTMTGHVLDAEGSTWSMPSRGSQPNGVTDKQGVVPSHHGTEALCEDPGGAPDSGRSLGKFHQG